MSGNCLVVMSYSAHCSFSRCKVEENSIGHLEEKENTYIHCPCHKHDTVKNINVIIKYSDEKWAVTTAAE